MDTHRSTTREDVSIFEPRWLASLAHVSLLWLRAELSRHAASRSLQLPLANFFGAAFYRFDYERAEKKQREAAAVERSDDNTVVTSVLHGTFPQVFLDKKFQLTEEEKKKKRYLNE